MSVPDPNNPQRPRFIRPVILKPGEEPPKPAPRPQVQLGKGPGKPAPGKPGNVKPGPGGPAGSPRPSLRRPAGQPGTRPAGSPATAESEPISFNFSAVAGSNGPKPQLDFTLNVNLDEPAEEEETDLTEEVVQGAPPWLVSAIAHVILLLIFALWFLTLPPSPKPYTLVVEPDIVKPEEPEEEEKFAEELGEQLEQETPIEVMQNTTEAEEHSDSELPPVDDPLAAPPETDAKQQDALAHYASYDFHATDPGMAFSGRNRGSKKGLMGKYGGTSTTEEAVKRGLRWLKSKQFPDGSWSLLGRYPNGAADENQISATAMALLAFQGAGYTHKSGTPTDNFKPQVKKGWAWLLKKQSPDGDFVWEEGLIHNHPFYTQGQVTIALCELYGMTEDKMFKEPAEKAVKYLLDAQGLDGGWRYTPKTDQSDISVTGWIVMALQSAKMANIEVPQETLDRITRFFDRLGQAGGTRYPYQRSGQASRVMTAEAILCRQYLGWKQDDERMKNALDYVLTEPINFSNKRDAYYWYYATQACHHYGGEHWKQWNAVMRQAIPENQVLAGPESGSWDPVNPSRDEWEAQGGRLYVTCLSLYMLEVYYRHLPIYDSVYDLLDEQSQARAKAFSEARKKAAKGSDEPETKEDAKP